MSTKIYKKTIKEMSKFLDDLKIDLTSLKFLKTGFYLYSHGCLIIAQDVFNKDHDFLIYITKLSSQKLKIKKGLTR